MGNSVGLTRHGSLVAEHDGKMAYAFEFPFE